MRMKLPGTSPPKVQKRYSTPSAILRTTSFTSSVTITFVACERLIGGGTFGACASTAISSPEMSGSIVLTLDARASAATEESGAVDTKSTPTRALVKQDQNGLICMT